LGSKTITPTQPKTTSFWSLKLFIYFLKKKKENTFFRKKERRKSGVAPLAKMGWPDHPHGWSTAGAELDFTGWGDKILKNKNLGVKF
jgi:hypothetical protein